MIQGDTTGFAKAISDPATRIVLGGTVVGHHTSKLIAPIASAAQVRKMVDLLFETLMVYPLLSESTSEAAWRVRVLALLPDDHNRCASRHRVADLDLEFDDLPSCLSFDFVLHLHCLEDAHGITNLD